MTTFTREDFEFAAKAAGVRIAWCDVFNMMLRVDKPPGTDGGLEEWNPPECGEDSHRLQVKLGLSIEPYPIYDQEKHSVVVKQRRRTDLMREVNQTEVVEPYGDNPYRATRHAVFRCAIAIGRAML